MITPILGKSVTVNEQALFQLHYLGIAIHFEQYDQPKEIKNSTQLSEVIKTSDEKNMCQGVKINENI